MNEKEFKSLLKLPLEEKREAIEKMTSAERFLLDVYIDKRLKFTDRLLNALLVLAGLVVITGCLLILHFS